MKVTTLISISLFGCAISSTSMADLWMTDGSTVVFEDTVKISEAMTPDDILGSQAYEGGIDPVVAIGSANLPVDKYSYVSVEAEWVIILPEDIDGPISLNTPVILQGMLDGKYFSEFSQNQSEWFSASLGNNLIAAGPGIPTTISNILLGGLNAHIDAYYKDDFGRDQFFTSSSESLKDLPVLELVNGVLERFPQTRYINMGAIESSSAFVNNDAIKAVAIIKSIAQLPWSGLPLNAESLKSLTLKNISRIITNFKKYMKNDAYIIVTDDQGYEYGEGLLSIQ